MTKDDEQIDALIQRVIEPPANLATHIKQAVHCGKLPQVAFEERCWWRSSIAAVAAVILLATGLSTWLIWGEFSKHPQQVESVVAVDAPAALQENNSLLLNDFDGVAKNNDYSMNLKVYPVGLNAQRTPLTRTVASSLPDKVRHVWTVNNLAEAHSLLEEIAKVNGKTLAVQKDWVTGKDSSVITLTDKELQSLVNKLQTREWNLFSKNTPQPYAPQQINFTGKQVEYMLCILPEE